MKIALVSIGIGRILRGFESFTESLFVELRRAAPGLDVTLFQGGGPEGNGRVIIRNFFRQDWLRTCLGNGSAIRLEQRSYALPLYLYLRRGRFDIVHYNELAMGSALFHLRRLFGGRFRLLYCNGAPSPPVHYHHRCDFAQVLTGPMYEEARSFGISPERLFLLPYGVDAHRFSPENRFHRSRIRSQLGIPENALVVLTVAALKREHKRVDYVIRELASLKEPFWLLAAGQRTEDTPFLEKEAERLLPGRWRFVSWPHASIHLLYGAADVFVLASLSEAFGLVTVEALLSGLPVIIHDSPTNQWILNGQPNSLCDLSPKGALAGKLKEMRIARSSRGAHETLAMRFSWPPLIPEYLRMYQKAVQTPNPGSNC